MKVGRDVDVSQLGFQSGEGQGEAGSTETGFYFGNGPIWACYQVFNLGRVTPLLAGVIRVSEDQAATAIIVSLFQGGGGLSKGGQHLAPWVDTSSYCLSLFLRLAFQSS